MSSSAKVHTAHLKRQAVLYLRQSSPRQVAKNQESAVNQRALQQRLRELGWKMRQITLIDDDTGTSGASACGREGFQKMVADVGLGKVGIIMCYEVSRLSRNCADWHRLLELCALFDTLIADADGLYHPHDFNDRLLLGLKGTMSEAELHSLRLRLDAGRLSKAKRGELIQLLPTGYVRQADGSVSRDPDQSVQDRIRLVFTTFLELGSCQKVLRFFVRNRLKVPRLQTSGPHVGEVLWKEPCLSAMREILKNPAYAGAFVHGRRATDPTRRVPGRPGTGHIRQPQSRWAALVKDIYPAYISWEEHEKITRQIAENWQMMVERMSRKRGQHERVPLLTGLLRCGHCGHAMRVGYKGNGIQYVCNAAQSKHARPSCQFVSGIPIDEAIVKEFFHVLQPAEVDVLDRLRTHHAEREQEVFQHLEQEIARLEYAAQRAERQYNSVDPENRLVAASLEKQWEQALLEFEQAQSRLKEAQTKSFEPIGLPEGMRQQFIDLGQLLPEVWPGLSIEAQRRLLRTLVKNVNLLRNDEGIAQIRIVWQGGFVTEVNVRVPVSSIRFSNREKQIAARIGKLIKEGKKDAAIAQQLNEEGYSPCRGGAFTPTIVLKLRCRHKLRLGVGRLREGNLLEGYTIRELTNLVGVDASWFHHRISKGKIVIEKNPRYGGYLFPRTKHTIERLKDLKRGKIQQASFPTEHSNG